MTFKTPIFILLTSIVFSCQFINAQDCLEYPEIEGSPCVGCWPVGWGPLGATTPDIIADDGSYPAAPCIIDDLSGGSPGGGNMVFLASIGPSYQEGMMTTITDLNTNQEYGFALYWEEISVNNCMVFTPGELLVTVDGVDYEFDDAEDW